MNTLRPLGQLADEGVDLSGRDRVIADAELVAVGAAPRREPWSRPGRARAPPPARRGPRPCVTSADTTRESRPPVEDEPGTRLPATRSPRVGGVRRQSVRTGAEARQGRAGVGVGIGAGERGGGTRRPHVHVLEAQPHEGARLPERGRGVAPSLVRRRARRSRRGLGCGSRRRAPDRRTLFPAHETRA